MVLGTPLPRSFVAIGTVSIPTRSVLRVLVQELPSSNLMGTSIFHRLDMGTTLVRGSTLPLLPRIVCREPTRKGVQTSSSCCCAVFWWEKRMIWGHTSMMTPATCTLPRLVTIPFVAVPMFFKKDRRKAESGPCTISHRCILATLCTLSGRNGEHSYCQCSYPFTSNQNPPYARRVVCYTTKKETQTNT